MFLKLTNASEGLEGSIILINSDKIISIHTVTVKEKQETYIYCGELGSWAVEESVDDISKLLNK